MAAAGVLVAAGPAVTGNARRLSSGQRRRVRRAVEQAERTTGVQFCVYLGPTSEDPRSYAEAMFEEAGLHVLPAVLLLVSPEERHVELVTSPEIQGRVSDRTCSEAIVEMTGFFATSDIAGGIVAGIQRLQTAVGPAPTDPSAATLPDVIED